MEDKKARCIHICQSVILFFAACLCLSFPFFVMVKGGRISLIYLLIDSLIYLSQMFMHIAKQFTTAAKLIVSL